MYPPKFFNAISYFTEVTLCCLCLSFSSLATSQPHAYLQAQGGIGGMFTKNYSTNDDPYHQVSLKNGMAYRLSTGILTDINLFHYGLEAGYASYPQNKYAFSFPSLQAVGVQKYTGHYFDLLGVVKYNLHLSLPQNFYLQGKLGVAYVTQKFVGTATALGTAFDFNTTVNVYEPECVVGIGYDFTKNISADLSYQHVFGTHADPYADPEVETTKVTQSSAINTLLIGIIYRF